MGQPLDPTAVGQPFTLGQKREPEINGPYKD